jgi:Gnt-I system low-affinity gluconate transporter
MQPQVLLAVLIAITVLLLLIIRLKIPAFISLLVASIVAGLISGLDPYEMMNTIKEGMGKSLGFIATVVGLGSIFGGILEHTGGAQTIASWLLKLLGEKRAPVAMMISGLLISIPIFFDVGIIIMFPLVVALYHRTQKSMLHFAVPLFAGLAVSHAFIPPTPGPLAVAETLNVSMGHIIAWGLIIGTPCAILSGLVYGKYIGNKIFVAPRQSIQSTDLTDVKHVGINIVLPILLAPIFLIVFSSVLDSGLINISNPTLLSTFKMICHPFSALIVANFLAWYILGKKAGLNTEKLLDISNKSLQPAGIIILVTGAGGVFKEVLVKTGAGEMMANGMQKAGFSIIVFAFITACLIRILQGSATVAMITAAGLVAPLLSFYQLNDHQLALITISIASGATAFSHLNDSGWWLTKEYLGVDERTGLKIWTVASTILGFTGFFLSLLIFILL